MYYFYGLAIKEVISYDIENVFKYIKFTDN